MCSSDLLFPQAVLNTLCQLGNRLGLIPRRGVLRNDFKFRHKRSFPPPSISNVPTQTARTSTGAAVHAGSIGLTGRQAKSRTCQGIRRARPTRRLRPKGSTAETPRNPHRVARGPGPSRGPGGFLGTFSAAKKYPGSGARSPGAIVEEKTGEGKNFLQNPPIRTFTE